jgi:hypothetical protein
VRIGLLIVLSIFFQFQGWTQQLEKIKIDVKQATLNEVLLQLKEDYGFQFAFDKDLLSDYTVSIHKEFSSQEETIRFLLKGLPLVFEKSGNVFLIIPEKAYQAVQPVKTNAHISGQVVEARSFEPLPFSYILVNDKSIQSDQQGNFTFLASADSTFNLKISHLGYFIYDTLVTGDVYKKFELIPRFTKIAEVRVEGNPVERATLIGDQPGKIKINHRIAPILPGYGDNSVFNMLRLMPGILAAGEQSSDLLIWGSYESHSKIQFDGFTIFGLKNFNDDIGVVNPLVLKDMEVFKGGYEAKYGDRVGGIINITGKSGTMQKPSFTLNINNTTVNSLLEIPVSSKSSLLAAYRQTFYELYDPSELQLFNRSGTNSFDVTLVPDYNFRDGNLKYSFHDKNYGVNISLYGGGDRYAYNMERELTNSTVFREEEEENKQWGGALSVYLQDSKQNTSKLKFAWSSLANFSNETNKWKNNRIGREHVQLEGISENNVNQFNVSAENRWNFKNGNYLESGLGMESNNVLIQRDLNGANLINMDSRLDRIFAYVQDYWPVSKYFELKAGLRANYVLKLNKFYPEPRILASLNLTEDLKLNVSWGLYHQFLAKTTLIDSTFNYYYFWTNADNETIPVLSGEHWVSGVSYSNKGITASIEGYYKTTTGLSRFINATNLLSRGFYNGEARSYGIDIFLKKEYKKNMSWVSYTLSKTEEHFPFYIREYYRPAPQDQRHELKFAGVVNYKSFYFSANYVYGSGFDRFIFTDDDGGEYIPDYNRLDAAVIYNFKPGKVQSQLGISVLNVLNIENIRLSNIRRVVADAENPLDVNTEAVPFTPTLFVKIKF